MSRLTATATLASLLLVVPATAVAASEPAAPESSAVPESPAGAPGIGDPYYPLDGNGGYDVRHYDLDLTYDPGTDRLAGEATLTAQATQDLSAFDLDLRGLEVESVVVDGRDAAWTRDRAELTVTPQLPLNELDLFRVVVAYSGVPQTLDELGPSGFVRTHDGAVVVGQPHVAATWFPANDHPVDTASYRFALTVPEGLQAIANGLLRDTRTGDGWSTWRWDAPEPMASYLAFMAVGRFDLREYRADGVRYWDALDPDLFKPAPRTGDRAAFFADDGEPAYARLTRTLTVPGDGGSVTFWLDRNTSPGAQFTVVEARPTGSEDWTTLPDAHGHTGQDPGFVCPFWLGDHPFLTHYLTASPESRTCLPTGTTGQWFAASGESHGFEQWSVDLAAYAGRTVELSISHVAPAFDPFPGVVVDDVVVSWGEGSTGFEEDGDAFDGWTPQGPPPGSPPDAGGWTVATAADVPASSGEVAEASLARQPEILGFLEGLVGPYPFRAAGGVVTAHPDLSFALETQSRPVYARHFFTDPVRGDGVVVHELAHQWFGDDLTIERWQHIWLNEGFATYAEWLWREREGVSTAQATFDALALTPPGNPLWRVVVGDPGPDHLLDRAVYDRGAMTLHALRREVGDEAFFDILRTWVAEQSGDHVTTQEFVAVAEEVSGRELDELFRVWLFTDEKPAGLA